MFQSSRRRRRYLWRAPTEQLFFAAALDGPASGALSFYELEASLAGCLTVRRHIAVTWQGNEQLDGFTRVARCFMPDLAKKGGSYDFVLGGKHRNAQPTVRVLEDFIPGRTAGDG